jgi:hypothetical protein
MGAVLRIATYGYSAPPASPIDAIDAIDGKVRREATDYSAQRRHFHHPGDKPNLTGIEAIPALLGA